MYAEDEITIKGATDSYVYKGGSGYENRAFFCKNCHVRIATRNDIMDGMVEVPLGTFDKANSLRPKLEIWRDEKLDMVEDIKGVVGRFKDSGISERLNALLDVLENR